MIYLYGGGGEGGTKEKKYKVSVTKNINLFGIKQFEKIAWKSTMCLPYDMHPTGKLKRPPRLELRTHLQSLDVGEWVLSHLPLGPCPAAVDVSLRHHVRAERGVGLRGAGQRSLARGAGDALRAAGTAGAASPWRDGLGGRWARVAPVRLSRVQKNAQGGDGVELGGLLVQFACGREEGGLWFMYFGKTG